MKFGEAIDYLKQGQKVARSGWNGSGMYLLLIKGKCVEKSIFECYGDPDRAYELDANGNQTGEAMPVLDAIYMKTATDELVPWLASQTDILSEDWEMVA